MICTNMIGIINSFNFYNVVIVGIACQCGYGIELHQRNQRNKTKLVLLNALLSL